MQDASTSTMIFPVATAIAYISSLTPLVAGDVIATGTPEGVGFRRDPPRYLADGDVVEVSIGPLGTLSNPVVAAAR
jgi:2-keto-4-pentenoate hydratase/2-oxohepta-3-ene-1,7-dioic acid hydratase in catechol pathway